MPPFDYDLGDAGKGPSADWMFWTSYNTERAIGKLEVTASQRDRDYIARAVAHPPAMLLMDEGLVYALGLTPGPREFDM